MQLIGNLRGHFILERARVFEELKLRIENKNTIKHSLAVEAIMRKLAKYFNKDEYLWGIAGLVHDIDYERIQGNMELHGKMGADILEGLNFDGTVVYAVRAHNPANNIDRKRKIDKALFCSDPISGLIIACALISKSKRLKDIDVKFVLNRYKQKDFAQNVSREQIDSCSELGLSLEDFIHVSLDALQEISDELGL